MRKETSRWIVSATLTLACTSGSTVLLGGCSDDGTDSGDSPSTSLDGGDEDDNPRNEERRDGGSRDEDEREPDAADDQGDRDASDDGDEGTEPDGDETVSGDSGQLTASTDAGASNASDAGEGSQTSEGPSSPEAGLPEVEIPNGSVPEELVGVWQETRASSGDYTNQFGEDFSATSGFSAQLKISPDGKYYFGVYASGVTSSCSSVSQFDQSVGSAVLVGDTLTLTPVQRRIDFDNCADSSSTDDDLTPIVLTASLTEDRQFYGGMRSYKLSLAGYSIPLDMSSLFRQPSYAPLQPEQPDGFVVGDTPPYAELQGLWVAGAGTDTSFYDPETDQFYLPELNGSSHQWLRFNQGSYETAVALQNVNSEGVCKLDLIYYEKGSATFATTEDVGGQGSHFVGHATFVSEDSRLIVNIRECDEDNGSVRYDLTPLSSYYRWIYFTPDNPPESFSWVCEFAESEWQSLLCGNGTVGLSRRE